MLIKDKLEKRIRILSDTIWKDRVEDGQLSIWLENFRNFDSAVEEKERLNMLYLLSNFMYFGNKETREMLKSIYRDKFQYDVYQELKTNYPSDDLNALEIKFQHELAKTKFLGVGNPSESGVHLLYYFRQENNLSKNNFINTLDIFNIDHSAGAITGLADPTIRRFIFIDDFCGSGHQAIAYSRDVVDLIKRLDNRIKVAYFPIFATQEALDKIKASTSFDSIDPVFVLDSSFKCFSTESRYFRESSLPSVIEKSFAKTTCENYGKQLFSPPLGYNDCQLLIGFFHNTPDNTLPIFWSERNGWRAFFKRYHKK